jgi:hypothetical protein
VGHRRCPIAYLTAAIQRQGGDRLRFRQGIESELAGAAGIQRDVAA